MLCRKGLREEVGGFYIAVDLRLDGLRRGDAVGVGGAIETRRCLRKSFMPGVMPFLVALSAVVESDAMTIHSSSWRCTRPIRDAMGINNFRNASPRATTSATPEDAAALLAHYATGATEPDEEARNAHAPVVPRAVRGQELSSEYTAYIGASSAIHWYKARCSVASM